MDFNIDPSKVIKYVFFKDLSTRIAGFFLRPWSVSGGYICSSGWASFQACKITRQETLPIQAATRSKDYEPLVGLKSAASKWLRESIHFLAGFGVCENIRPGRPKAVGQEVAGRHMQWPGTDVSAYPNTNDKGIHHSEAYRFDLKDFLFRSLLRSCDC